MNKILVFFITLVISVTASAQVIFSPGLSYTSTDNSETTPSTVSGSSSGLTADLRLGYVLPMGLYLGGMYSLTNNAAVPGLSGDDAKGNLFGPTVGYHSMMGFYMLLTYHILGSSEHSAAGVTSTYNGAKGPQIDMGWVFPVARYFSIGPQLTWRSIEFDKFETAGTSVDTDRKVTTIQPYISLWFMF